MLKFQFKLEDGIRRPYVNLLLHGKYTNREVEGLLDSGADRSIIPLYIAELLDMPKGRDIVTSGIGGPVPGYESILTLSFYDGRACERLFLVPVYVIDKWSNIIIGRDAIFDQFRVIIEQFNNCTLLESI